MLLRRLSVTFGAAVVLAAALSSTAHAELRPGNASAPARSVFAVRVQIAGGRQPVPLTAARVVMRAAGRTIAVGRTYGRGLAVLTGRIPARFELRTTGGWIGQRPFQGHLLASITLHGREHVAVVDPATTLSSMLCHDLNASVGAQCDNRVRALLRLPRGTDLGRDLGGDGLFDGHRFLVTARRHGGVARYLSELEHLLRRHPRATHDFHHRESARVVHSRVPASARSSRRHGPMATAVVQDESASWLESLVDDAAGNADPQQLVSTLYKLISGGGGESISSQLSSMQSEMTQMAGELADLSNKVAQVQSAITQGNYSQLASNAAKPINGIMDAESSFNAVLDEAVQIGCGNYGASAGGPAATCAAPQSPADVCTASAVAASAQLKDACTAFAGLPLPAGSSAGAPQGLVGDFLDELNENTLQDEDVQTIANNLGGNLVPGESGPAQGMLQLAAQYVSSGQFFTTANSQDLQNVYGYYMDALLEGTTIRMAYWAFTGKPVTQYNSPVTTTLDDIRALHVAAPQPLPSGTFIDTAAYTMWSGQIGAVETQPTYAAQVAQGAKLSLPTANRHANAGASTPTLANGTPFSDWSAGQQGTLQTLYGHVPAHPGTPGDYLVGSANSSLKDPPAVWPGLFSDGTWNGQSYAVGDNFAQENPSARGFTFSGSPDKGYFDQGRATVHEKVPSLELNNCVPAGNAGCPEPTWASGTASGVYDLNNGQDPPHVSGSMVDGSAVQNWGNWSSDQRYCVKEAFLDIYCMKHRTYPGITNHLTLPVLFNRTPTPTQTECYYWPASGASAKGNGCPG